MSRTMSHTRRSLRRVLVAFLVCGFVAATALTAGWRANVERARASNAAEAAQAANVADELDRTISDRLAQLAVAGSFIASSYPTDPSAYSRYLASYRLSTDFTDLSLGVFVLTIDVSQIPALEAQERVWDPSFQVFGVPPGATGLRDILLRSPEDLRVVGRSLNGFDVTEFVDRVDLPDDETNTPHLYSMRQAAESLDAIVGSEVSTTTDLRRFFQYDLIGVQHMYRADGSALGIFIVPVRLDDLVAGRSASFHVRVALLDEGFEEELVGTTLTDEEMSYGLLDSRLVTPQRVPWRVEVYAASPLEHQLGVDRTVTTVAGAIASVLAAIVLVSLHVRRRRHSLLAELDETTRQAVTDHLTGVCNRVGLERGLDAMLARTDGRRVYVMLLDLDRFKLVNDTQGHDAGDALLCTVAQRLEDYAGGAAIVARFGGDEFVVATDRLADDEEARTFAEGLGASVRNPVELPDGGYVGSGSVGIACASAGTGATVGELLRDADVAMYHAKRDPSLHCALFDERMRHETIRVAEVEQDLRGAIARGEIVPYFQPVFDRQGGLVAFEALARWQHPDRGLLAPGQFLDVAESVGAIPELDAQILRRSCEEAAAWNRDPQDPPVSVFVNLHDDVLRNPHLADDLRTVIETVGLAPGLLTLEIPEERLLDRTPQELDQLREIAALGINLAIDDFGRGRSSLLTLADFDMISVLKLDLGFVRKLPLHEPTRSVFCAVRDVAHSLEMSVVAEGVETTAEARVLSNLGIDYVQGFLYGHPITKARAAELLRETRRGERVVVDLRRL